jgi:hypothetical protein
MIEWGLIVDECGKLLVVVSEGGKLQCFEIFGMNEQGNWLVI